MMQTIKGTASRNVIFGGITYVLAEDIYYDAKDWAPIEPRAQVKSPEGAEIYWYFPDADSLAAWIDTDNLDTCMRCGQPQTLMSAMLATLRARHPSARLPQQQRLSCP